jgi:hypothetical protein
MIPTQYSGQSAPQHSPPRENPDDFPLHLLIKALSPFSQSRFAKLLDCVAETGQVHNRTMIDWPSIECFAGPPARLRANEECSL